MRGCGLNVRLGFARLARVTAILYGVVSVLIVGFVVKGRWDERQVEMHPHMFTVSAPSGRVYVVPAQYDWEAISAAEDYDKAHPSVSPAEEPTSNVRELTDEQLLATANGKSIAQPGGSVAPLAAAPGTFSSADTGGASRGDFDGADIFAPPPKKKAPAQKPIRVPVAKYDDPSTVDAVAKEGAIAALWCGLVYAVLWAVFRGIRWVALGFMDAKSTNRGV